MDYYREHGENHEEAVAPHGDPQTYCFKGSTPVHYK